MFLICFIGNVKFIRNDCITKKGGGGSLKLSLDLLLLKRGRGGIEKKKLSVSRENVWI